MPEIQKPFLQTFRNSNQSAFNFLDRLTVKVHTQFNFKLFPH